MLLKSDPSTLVRLMLPRYFKEKGQVEAIVVEVSAEEGVDSLITTFDELASTLSFELLLLRS
jgi:hypothetical protein